MGVTDQDNLRDRIAELIAPSAWRMQRIPEMPGWPESTEVIEPSREKAQAIIDEFELTVHGDDCGYHEIHGSYDTRFEEH